MTSVWRDHLIINRTDSAFGGQERIAEAIQYLTGNGGDGDLHGQDKGEDGEPESVHGIANHIDTARGRMFLAAEQGRSARLSQLDP